MKVEFELPDNYEIDNQQQKGLIYDGDIAIEVISSFLNDNYGKDVIDGVLLHLEIDRKDLIDHSILEKIIKILDGKE